MQRPVLSLDIKVVDLHYDHNHFHAKNCHLIRFRKEIEWNCVYIED